MEESVKNMQNETPVNYAKRYIKVKNNADELNPIRIAFLTSYTSEVLNPYISVELSKHKYFAENYFAPFNQFEQEIFNLESKLYSENPDVIFFHNMIEDMYPDMVSNFSKFNDSELKLITKKLLDRYKGNLEELRKNSKAPIIVSNFTLFNSSEDSPLLTLTTQKKNEFIRQTNYELSLISSEISDCFILDYMEIVSKVGIVNWIDRKLYLMARIPFSVEAQIEFGKKISNAIYIIKNQSCKCLVLDLDNTLWGGVIGEDGINGIDIGETYPGNVFKDFQRNILNLKNQGIMLAIASKNNYEDAMKALNHHPDCILRASDFASIEISWDDKATSIQKIAKKLNIGMESIVFFDDNPTERQWVSTKLPIVKVIDVPENPMLFSNVLNNCNYFSFLKITSEDIRRTEMIHQNQKREELSSNMKSLESFLISLELRVSIGFATKDNVERISQLTNKTNQFNLTTKRYTVTDINNFIDYGDLVLYISVEDCFGSYGISGAAIIRKENINSWAIDTFLLSCRIIGKKIESAFLFEIVNVLKKRGATKLVGYYYPTKKNILTKSFYKNHSFLQADNTKNIWNYDLNKSQSSIDFIRIKWID